MSGIVYKAVYTDSGFYHGKYKYIDKWRSKSGKWVYKYKQDLDQTVNDVRKKLSERDRRFVIRPKSTKKSSKNSGWHDTGTDVTLSKQQSYEASIKGYDRTRLRKVKDSSGKTTYRREWQDSAQQNNVNRKINSVNDARKSSAGIFKSVMDLNDKYGPKSVTKIHKWTGDGRHYVMEVTQNLVGGRATGADVYYYKDTKRIERDKDSHKSSKKKRQNSSTNRKRHKVYTRR